MSGYSFLFPAPSFVGGGAVSAAAMANSKRPYGNATLSAWHLLIYGTLEDPYSGDVREFQAAATATIDPGAYIVYDVDQEVEEMDADREAEMDVRDEVVKESIDISPYRALPSEEVEELGPTTGT